MRAQLIGAVLAAVLACGGAYAQTPKAKETVAEKELREKSGSQAEKLLKGEATAAPPGDKMVEDFLADLEPISVQMERAKREAELRAILQGKSGPFMQIKVAWEEREWPPLLYGAGIIVLWLAGGIFVLWLISGIVSRLRGER